MNLLYFAKAKEDVLRGDRVREGAIAAVVDERDGEFLDALWATMIIKRGQTSNIEQPNFAGTSKAFFVAGAGRMDEPQHKRYLAFVVAGAVRMDDPPHDRYLGTWVCRARTVWSIKTDMAIGIVWAPTIESCEVDSGGITPEGPLERRRRCLVGEGTSQRVPALVHTSVRLDVPIVGKAVPGRERGRPSKCRRSTTM
jgi:hypothetical protein